MRRLTYFVVIGLLSLAGCGTPKPIKYYTVQAPSAPSPSSTAFPIDLIVKRLSATQLLEAAPIVFRTGANQMGTYTYHPRWIWCRRS